MNVNWTKSTNLEGSAFSFCTKLHPALAGKSGPQCRRSSLTPAAVIAFSCSKKAVLDDAADMARRKLANNVPHISNGLVQLVCKIALDEELGVLLFPRNYVIVHALFKIWWIDAPEDEVHDMRIERIRCNLRQNYDVFLTYKIKFQTVISKSQEMCFQLGSCFGNDLYSNAI